MSRPYRVPTGWTDDAARLVWEDYLAAWAAMQSAVDTDFFVRLEKARADAWRVRAERDAERAARRKWELRLRARANAAYERFDRLSIRAYNVGHRSKELPVLVLLGSGVRGWPKHNIAGPRGVLP